MTLHSRRISPSSVDSALGWRLRPSLPPPALAPLDPTVEVQDSECVRVVLAVAEPERRWVLRRSFERTGRLEVLAEVGDGRACLEAVRDHAPDAVVIELDLVDGDDLYVPRLVEGGSPSPAVVALDGLSDPLRLERVLRSGAVGVVRHDAPPRDLAAQVELLLRSVREEFPEPA